MKITKTSIKGWSREQWLEARTHSIGGSDAAAIAGVGNQYKSAYSVWAEKTGRGKPFDGNEATMLGNELEDFVAQRFAADNGKKVQAVKAIIKNSEIPFAHANIDRRVVGEKAGLECKTTATLNLKKFADGKEFPDQYYAQCVHYLMVTGWDRWYLAVYVLQRGMFYYTLERNETEIEALRQAEERFWGYVQRDDPPPVDGSDSTTETLGWQYRDSSDRECDISRCSFALGRLEELKAMKKELDTQISEKENEIKAVMQDSEAGFCGLWKATWKAQTRTGFDYKRFMADHPEMDFSKYVTATTSRVFKITKMKEKK